MLDMLVREEKDKEKYEEACKKIFDMHEKIRFVGILDSNGKLIAGGMREGIEPLEDEIHEKRWFHQTAIRREMTTMFENIYGKVRYVFANREKVKQLTFYIDDKILFISIQPEVSAHETIDLAESILKS
ncbi:MAG: hypothetical protein KatS3mg003_0340 [Candidatus Nitrosocaldaceae archaeon]|nr:MAG: hypothetical protein KatS3mg003_0340 [Candidatus Nitrosocaldaceae archaeon]